MDAALFSSREVLAWPETRAFLIRLGVLPPSEEFVEKHILALKITLGTDENPVVVEHSYLAHWSGLSAPCPGEGQKVTPQPVSRQSNVVDEDRFAHGIGEHLRLKQEREQRDHNARSRT